jgi:hypothetical protein
MLFVLERACTNPVIVLRATTGSFHVVERFSMAWRHTVCKRHSIAATWQHSDMTSRQGSDEQRTPFRQSLASECVSLTSLFLCRGTARPMQTSCVHISSGETQLVWLLRDPRTQLWAVTLVVKSVLTGATLTWALLLQLADHRSVQCVRIVCVLAYLCVNGVHVRILG